MRTAKEYRDAARKLLALLDEAKKTQTPQMAFAQDALFAKRDLLTDDEMIERLRSR